MGSEFERPVVQVTKRWPRVEAPPITSHENGFVRALKAALRFWFCVDPEVERLLKQRGRRK